MEGTSVSMYIEKFHKEVASVMVAMSAVLARCQSLGYVNIVHKVGEMYAASLIPERNMVCVFCVNTIPSHLFDLCYLLETW